MALVKFAELCDHCGQRSEEYTQWCHCVHCLLATCDRCMVPGSAHEEVGYNECLSCADEIKAEEDNQ